MTSRSLFLFAALLLVTGFAVGCATPSYELPAGYSSTYSRALNSGVAQP